MRPLSEKGKNNASFAGTLGLNGIKLNSTPFLSELLSMMKISDRELLLKDQSIDFAAHLDSLGLENELVLMDGIGHTFHLESWGGKPFPVDVRQRVLSFFDRHMMGLSGEEAQARYDVLKTST